MKVKFMTSPEEDFLQNFIYHRDVRIHSYLFTRTYTCKLVYAQ